MHKLADFYHGKKVFLTGGTGFKGSWLCLFLQSLGAEVFDYSLAPPSTPSLWGLANIEQEVKHCRANILDRQMLKQNVNNIKPDIVIHLAAQSLVRPSYDAPYDTLETNIMGTASLLDAVLSCPSVRATLIITSDKCYESIDKPYPYTEDDRMGGYDPYSTSKGCAELISNAYRKSFFDTKKQGLASVRAGNVIGGGDFAVDRLVPDMVRAFCKDDTLMIRYPHATRPWQHVLDPLNGYLILVKELYTNPHNYSEAWNFGPSDNEAHTVEEVVRLFSTEWEQSEQKGLSRQGGQYTQNAQGANYRIDSSAQAHETRFLGLNCEKAEKKLNWKPKLSFNESVAWTAKWYKTWHSDNNMNVKALCYTQIQNFMEK